jgi:hypothetical protein
MINIIKKRFDDWFLGGIEIGYLDTVTLAQIAQTWIEFKRKTAEAYLQLIIDNSDSLVDQSD